MLDVHRTEEELKTKSVSFAGRVFMYCLRTQRVGFSFLIELYLYFIVYNLQFDHTVIGLTCCMSFNVFLGHYEYSFLLFYGPDAKMVVAN